MMYDINFEHVKDMEQKILFSKGDVTGYTVESSMKDCIPSSSIAFIPASKASLAVGNRSS